MTRVFKKIFHGIISFVLALWVVMAGLFPAVLPGVFAKADTVLTYEQTNVMDDLKQSTIEGKPFSLTDYSFNAFKETEVLSFVEYCYSFYENMQDSYGLYIYVYNPKGLTFDLNSSLNCIQFAYGLDSSLNYTKYPLKFLNYSTEPNYQRLFYKFKVVLSPLEKEELLTSLNSTERVYRVSGVELKEKNNINATDFSVSTIYRYSGYAAGFGSDPSAENTLICKSEEAEVLTLNVHPTQYRPEGTNGKNDYTQDSLHSVYFAVPNDVIDRYGIMSAVHATWRDAVLKPALVTGNSTGYNALFPYLGVDIGVETDDLDYGYLGAYKRTVSGTTGLLQSYSYSGFSYNVDHDPTFKEYGYPIETLYLMFQSEEELDSADGHTVSAEEITEQLVASKTKFGGNLINGKYSSKVFESVAEDFTDVNIQADENFSLTSETISTKWWHLMFHRPGDVVSTTFDGIQAIYSVKDSDLEGTKEEVADRLFISESDYEDFKSFYDLNKSLCTVYLFRYQVTDYMAQEASFVEKGSLLGASTLEEIDTNAYFFQETVNLDFDIIDVTFSNGETNTVIPVVSNPIDVVPDATPPVYTQSDKEPDWLKWLKIVIVVILFVVLIIVGWPLLQPLFTLIGQGIVWLVTAPFKAIGNAIKKRKRKKEDEEEYGENG